MSIRTITYAVAMYDYNSDVLHQELVLCEGESKEVQAILKVLESLNKDLYELIAGKESDQELDPGTVKEILHEIYRVSVVEVHIG